MVYSVVYAEGCSELFFYYKFRERRQTPVEMTRKLCYRKDDHAMRAV